MRFSVLTASALLLLQPLTAAAMGISVIIDGQTVVFKDVPESTWYSASVKGAVDLGIVNGYKDDSGHYTGLFGPSDHVTIAQALKIAVEGAGYQKDLYTTSIDAGVGTHWAAPYVAVGIGEKFPMVEAGMRLDRAATRAEVAAIFAAAFRANIDMSASTNYKDVTPGMTQAPYINALSRDKVMTGDTNEDGTLTNTFRPTDFLNRAEVVKMALLARTTYGKAGEDRAPISQ